MLNSITTQIPFTYHSLNLCIDKNATKPDETFTELLTGTRAEYSNYTIKINKNETCKLWKIVEKKNYDLLKIC